MKRNPGALAKALFSNTPEAPNELAFRKGEILTIIEYDYDGQLGWWLCACRGHRGICPGNYLELLEDKYTTVTNRGNRSFLQQRSLSQNAAGEAHESALDLGNTNVREGNEGFDPLETYDVPRSSAQKLSKSLSLVENSPPLYSNTDLDQPLYQNEEAFFPLTEPKTPLDLYDVPRSQLPVYGQSLSRLRKYGPDSDSSLLRSNSSNFATNSFSHSTSSYDLGLPPSGNTRSDTNRRSPTIQDNKSVSCINISNINTIPRHTKENNRSIRHTSGTSEVELRNPYYRQHNNYSTTTTPTSIPINHSNRSSIQSESAESGIVMVSYPPMQDLYDVPRSVLTAAASDQVSTSTNRVRPSSRYQSSLSITSSGTGLSIANSDSKDSLDLYDVPRSAKSYVNHMETKYDQVQSRFAGSSASLARESASTMSGHSRHNSTSSIFSAYGYKRGEVNSHGGNRTSDFQDNKRPSLDFGSRFHGTSCSSINNAHFNQANDLYDVPRSHVQPPPPNPRTNRQFIGASSSSIASSRSQVSLISEGENYDVPSAFARKVSLGDSTETLSCKETFDENFREMCPLGASSCSLSSSSSNHLRSASQCNSSSNNNSQSQRGSVGASGSSEVKILPLGPKSAVSVCEKLRHEVITSITSILEHVKPKWRSKDNLTAVMPDLKFSCVRLSLAIKDMADFVSRTVSNAKQTGDEAIVTKLHRLLTPLMNGSQIIQRDVDELEAYFWSVDRLSISGSNQEKNISGDALDQLIMCARSLKHDVTEIANYLALNSSTLFKESDRTPLRDSVVEKVAAEATVKDTHEDYDYVSLMSTSEAEEKAKKDLSSTRASSSLKPSSLQLDSIDQQLLEFYSAQIGVTAPMLSQWISTFISSIHQNDPPENFNVHLKYVILLAYKMLFAGDTVHRNVNNAQLKKEIESKANDLHKSILALYDASKVATVEFPKIGPMQSIVDKVWSTTQAATTLKRVIFSATCTAM